MSSIKISELTSLDQASRGDLLIISDVSTGASRKISFRALVAQAYADIKLLAATATQGLTTTAAKVTVFDGTTGSYNCVIAADHDAIDIEEDGVYSVDLSIGGYLDSAKTASFLLAVNGVTDADSQIISVMSAGAGNAISASFSVLKSFSAGDNITIYAGVNSTTANITYNNIDLVIRKIDSNA